jgi:predicted transcriptional regulator
MASTTLTLRPELAAELDELAASTGREPAALADEALSKYLDYERWAMAQIREGLRQANAGEFASDDEAERVFNLYRDAANVAS